MLAINSPGTLKEAEVQSITEGTDLVAKKQKEIPRRIKQTLLLVPLHLPEQPTCFQQEGRNPAPVQKRARRTNQRETREDSKVKRSQQKHSLF